jgi:hypothetical protein
MADCARKRMLRLLSRLDRVLVAGLIDVDLDDSPPDGPARACASGGVVSLGAVVFVGVTGESVDAWRRGYPQTYALNYQGKRRHNPSLDIILSDASMKSEGGSFTLSVGDISSVCIRTASTGGQLITNGMVGLHIATSDHGDILLNLVAIRSTVGYSLTTGLQKLTDFLTRPNVPRTPNSIFIDRNCNIEIWIDPGLTLVFQPITECYAPVSEG